MAASCGSCSEEVGSELSEPCLLIADVISVSFGQALFSALYVYYIFIYINSFNRPQLF